MNFQNVLDIVDSRNDLVSYGNNSLMIWALQIRYQIEDATNFAANNLTDGFGDKKCDLIWVNRDDEFAIIAQSYRKKDEFDTGEAPANKASDLNVAISWVLGDVELELIPDCIKAGVKDLREAIADGEISTLYVLYFHNMHESKNVQDELDRVKETAQKYLINSLKKVNVISKEIGQETIIDWFESISNPILVNDSFEIKYEDGYEIKEVDWEAITTTIRADWLYDIYTKYGDKLFSANQRGYLGSRNSDSNINNGIKESAIYSPQNFWAFHNGISIIVNDYSISDDKSNLIIKGISIINGAQTTGAIGNLSQKPDHKLQIHARFIKCLNRNIINYIVRFNNSQNRMIPSDFRSTDPIQKKLIQEFIEYPHEIIYSGGRRGSESDAISRNPNSLSSDTVAQGLTAFHGRPDIAYKYKGRIWLENHNYDLIFNDRTSCKHILFVFSLFNQISKVTQGLKQKPENELTDIEKSQLQLLSGRGGVFLLIYAISESMETFLKRRISDRQSLKFTGTEKIEVYQGYWIPIINIALSFAGTLQQGLVKYTFTLEDIRDAISRFTQLIQSTEQSNIEIYKKFASCVDL